MKKNRFCAVVLSFFMVFSLVITTSYAAESSKKDREIIFNIPSAGDNIKGDFNYYSSVSHSDGVFDLVREAEYYYSDSYFTSPSTSYNSHLATLSFISCMTAFNKLDLTKNDCYANAAEFFSSMGFTNFETNAETDYPPTEDTIGVVMAEKRIIDGDKAYDLVNITIRGGGYGSEWASNFLVGDAEEQNGNHKGFYDSRDRALAFIKDYLKRNANGDTKLWITGFSRGAAVSGLIGAWFDDNLDRMDELEINIEFDDIFTYTFESPASTDEKNLVGRNYSNIFNILNGADLVPRLPFSGNAENGWNFARPGEEKHFGDMSDEDAAALNEIIKEINPYTSYDVNNFTAVISSMGKTQDAFLDNFFNDITLRISRAEYVSIIQDVLCEIVGNITDNTTEEMQILVDDLIGGIAADLGVSGDFGIPEILQIIGSVLTDDPSSSSVVYSVGKNLERVGAIEEYNEDVRECLSAFLDVFVRNDDSGKNLILYLASIFLNSYEETASDGLKISNNRIISAHIPEVILGFLVFYDTNYILDSNEYSQSSSRPVVEVRVILDGKSYISYYHKGDRVVICSGDQTDTHIEGWYIGDTMLSDGNKCTFVADKDITVNASSVKQHENGTGNFSEAAWISDPMAAALIGVFFAAVFVSGTAAIFKYRRLKTKKNKNKE